MSLGEFDHIKTVSKFAARLGQCFSTTRAMGVTVELTTTPDKKHNNFIFTDGVGKLSPFLAQMAAQELGLVNAFTDPPSLFHLTGVLALDPKLKRNQVKIRPNQYKFRAPYTGLEIIRSSSFATPYFNRQIILVLSYLGVQDAVFLRKQEDMMNEYSRAMADETTALQKLRKNIDINAKTGFVILMEMITWFYGAQIWYQNASTSRLWILRQKKHYRLTARFLH
ncbi:RNA dependent RNA polymerase-domain-containing protein [Bipolaris maydis]|uniref:RNA dependent RNA polymerase-domain-containing protein n=1 Tax=Cochliobolus heterostrophus TaxID=5016 RepID=UPI0024D6D2AA|nr:RNA dependent RNA polymerase-domain-containing protein [Bipolaris maydis]